MKTDLTTGISLDTLHAELATARLHGDDDGVAWPSGVWERIWSRLNPTQQRVVFMHVLIGEPRGSIATQLGISFKSVNTAWHAALGFIREALTAEPTLIVRP